jgi:phosphoglycolate phosphatase
VRLKQNIIFDLDGTLVDSLPGIAGSINAALPPSVGRVSDMRSFIGPPVRSILQALAQTECEGDLDQMERKFRQSYDAGGWRDTVEFSGAKDLLERLRAAGKRLFVATNKPSQPAEKILGALGLRGYFEDVLTPDSRNPPFPNKAQMLRELVRRHDLRIEECLMVGDTADDGNAAAALGMDAVFVAHGYGGARLAAEFPDCRMVPDLGVISTRLLENGVAYL